MTPYTTFLQRFPFNREVKDTRNHMVNGHDVNWKRHDHARLAEQAAAWRRENLG